MNRRQEEGKSMTVGDKGDKVTEGVAGGWLKRPGPRLNLGRTGVN